MAKQRLPGRLVIIYFNNNNNNNNNFNTPITADHIKTVVEKTSETSIL
jgi:hypothetical protein